MLKFAQFSSCSWSLMRGGSSSALCTALEQLSLLTSTSTATKCISTSSSCLSQSKFLRYARTGVRQSNPEYELSNLTQSLPSETVSTSWFPTAETANEVFDGIRFANLPIVHIKATRNNTIISVNNSQTGHTIAIQSSGTVGFRNAKKGTNVAAQAAAVAIAGDALRKDIRTVRVCMKGLGPGRQAAVKSLMMAGLNIVSISDTTKLAFKGYRPKKVRRL